MSAPGPLTVPSPQGTVIAGLGHSLPARVVANSEIEARLSLAEGWIERRTGIRARHIAGAGDSLTAHAAAAATAALNDAGIDAIDIDLVLVATTTQDELLPNTAPLVAAAIGASRAGAFDIGAACTGFLSAVAAGAAWIESGRAANVLAVGADFMSRITDPMDRGTAAVFADGAGAAVLAATPPGAGRIGPIILGADGANAGHIRVEHAAEPHIYMDGHGTFRHAVARISQATRAAAAAVGAELDDIELFVYHQANSRILAAVGDALGLDGGRVVDCIAELGNTSAATLPLALHHAAQTGRLADGTRVLLGTFGAGLTWGATVIEWGRGHDPGLPAR